MTMGTDLGRTCHMLHTGLSGAACAVKWQVMSMQCLLYTTSQAPTSAAITASPVLPERTAA